MRPFANFVANGDVTLYAHSELLDEATRLLLFHPKTTDTDTATALRQKLQTKRNNQKRKSQVVKSEIDIKMILSEF
jgi:hypothetical protein